MQNSFNEKLRVAKDYLNFRRAALSRFSIHSPFLFELVNDVFRDNRDYYAFSDIEKIRQSLLSDARTIEENHFGEQSKALPQQTRKVSDIARVTSLPQNYGKLLFRLVNHLRPGNFIELGTGLGISALYLASAESSAPFITLEGSQVLSAIAQEQFSKLQLKNIRLLEGDFNETLPKAIRELGKIHFIFLDGDHRKDSVIRYIRLLLPHLAENATIVIDDIYWSEEMNEAWKEVAQLPQATLTVDLFRMGILFFREGIKVKQDLKVVIY
ncbi:MAG: class I SAM-dependent methyltransferase [Chitinophagales bacterium]|nr:class I SAM-dependent methyltransferase [Chitinophagales bacterium]